jgi:ABC-type Fe3+ transport system permease subunit
MSRVRQRKWAILAVAGTTVGIAMLLLFRSISAAAGTATGVVVAIIVLKHVALAMVVGSPITAAFQSVKPTIRSHCPFAKP